MYKLPKMKSCVYVCIIMCISYVFPKMKSWGKILFKKEKLKGGGAAAREQQHMTGPAGLSLLLAAVELVISLVPSDRSLISNVRSVHYSAAVGGCNKPRERMLLHPEDYIGSVEKCTRNLWVVNGGLYRE
jgi:hypothetical protein